MNYVKKIRLPNGSEYYIKDSSVEQVYDPSSENPQSGVAVAEAINELLEDNSYKTTITGDNTTTQFTITHNLGSRDIIVIIYDNSYSDIAIDTTRLSINSIRLDFDSAPSSSQTFTVVCSLPIGSGSGGGSEGDMLTADYDSALTVKTAGGIVSYVNTQIQEKVLDLMATPF